LYVVKWIWTFWIET